MVERAAKGVLLGRTEFAIGFGLGETAMADVANALMCGMTKRVEP